MRHTRIHPRRDHHRDRFRGERESVKVTSMCARLYGRHSAVTRADAAVNAAEVAE
jgi:hypothetical protein